MLACGDGQISCGSRALAKSAVFVNITIFLIKPKHGQLIPDFTVVCKGAVVEHASACSK